MPDPTYRPVHTDPELQAFVKARVQQRLREMKAQVGDDYVQQAVEHYSRAGSPLVNEFYKMKEGQAKQAATDATPHMGGIGDVAERTVRDVASGAMQGITSPGRFVAKHLGIGDADAAKEWMQGVGGDEAMGGRGISSNPVVGTIQSAVEPGAEMYANAKTIGNRAFEGAGNMFGNAASKLPQSRVLQALAPKPGAGFVKNLLPEMAKGAVGGAISMPDAVDSPTGLGYMGAMGALGALGHASIGRPDATATPRPNPVSAAWKGLNDLFEAPPRPQTPAAPRPAEPPPVNTTPSAPPPEPVAASPTTPSAPPVPTEPQAGPSSAGFGGDPVDWGTVDPETRAKVDAAWGAAKTIQDRAKLLGVEGPALGAGGKPLDSRVAENLQNAQKPEDLLGYMQRGLLRSSGGKVPRGTKSGPPAVAKPNPAIEAQFMEDHPDVDLKTPEGQAVRQTWEQTQGLAPKPPKVGSAPISAEPLPATPPKVRTGKLKPKDILTDAPKLDDGTLDWDKLTTEQRDVVSKKLGKDYRGKVGTMNLASIQKMLKNPQFETFMKALKVAPPGAEVPTAEAAEAAGAPPSAPTPELPLKRGSPKGIVLPGAPDAPVQPALAAEQPSEPASQPGVSEVKPTFSAAGWDGLPVQAKIPHLEKLVGDKGAASTQALLPFEDLPARVRAVLQGDPEVASSLSAAKAVGGAPEQGAGFRGKRKARPEPGPARPDPGSPAAAGRRIDAKRKPQQQSPG